MGQVFAAGPSVPASPPLVPPPPMATPGTGGPGAPSPSSPSEKPGEIPQDTGPGTFEDLHKKCKDLFPNPFEGAKLIINKGLSNHFQISHTATMSSLTPSGYKFGATYVGSQTVSPTEAYPILVGDIDPSGNMNANIIHAFSKRTRCKFGAQVQGGRWLTSQLSAEYRGEDNTAVLTLGNPDIINESGVVVLQYLQNVTSRVCLGTELLYQYGPTVPGNEIGIYTIAGRYSGNDWQFSGNLTPAAAGVHLCYYQKVNDKMQIGCEIEGSLRTRECTSTIGYQMDVPSSNFTFKGQLDSNWCIGAVLEKRLPPLPFTFALSGFANHNKNTYRFGVGFVIG